MRAPRWPQSLRQSSFPNRVVMFCVAAAVTCQVAQLVMLACGGPLVRGIFVAQAAAFAVLGLMLFEDERQLHGKRSTLVQWGHALDRRHALLDDKERSLDQREALVFSWEEARREVG